jgi:hypothetical protein
MSKVCMVYEYSVQCVSMHLDAHTPPRQIDGARFTRASFSVFTAAGSPTRQHLHHTHDHHHAYSVERESIVYSV